MKFSGKFIQPVNWRKQFYLILYTDLWKQWHELPLINLLIHVKQAKLRKHDVNTFTYKIRNWLRKKFNYQLKPFYQVTIPSSTLHIAPQIHKWIRSLILRN